jgi:hypothetical protein
MSRIKKSRKPASAPKAKPKLSKKELASIDKRVRKSKGKPAGNKQKEAQRKKSSSSVNTQPKDPRVGSKKPIVLLKTKSLANTPSQNKVSNIAAVKLVDTDIESEIPSSAASAQDHNSEALIAEIEAIEQDEQLLTIVAKQDADEALTAQEIDYYNQQMERHQEISEQLGWHDESEEENAEEDLSDISDEGLLDKLDNNHFNDL